MAERRLGLLQSLRERHPVSTLALGLAVALAAALTVNLGHSPTEYKVGQTLGRAVTARVPFRIPDPQLTQSRRIQARDNSPNYYQLDAALLEDLRGRLTSVLTLARTYADEPERLTDEAAKIRIVLDEAARAELSRLAAGDSATEYQQAVDRVLELLRAQPLVEASDLAGRRTSTNAILMDPDRQTEQSVHINNLRVADAETIASVAEAAAAPLPAPLRPSIQQSLTRLLSEGAAPQGLYRFDRALTAQKGEEARDAIPEQFTEFPANAVLADGGPISREEHALLGAEHAAYIAQRAANSRWPWGADLGRAILAFVVVASVVGNFAMVGVKQRPNVVRQVVTAGAMVALLLAARLVYVHAQTLPAQVTLAPLALAAALLAIVYRRPGLVYPLIITLALLITISTRRGLEFLFVQLATATALAALLRDVRNRGQIVGAGVVAAVVAGFMTAVAGLIQTQTGPYILWIAGWAAGATLAAAFVVEGILPAIERAFKTSTSMTLLEWCDANKPLLRMMAAEAPGTYNHSLLVGALGEAAAESIGANGLLCRAGA
ncbi:MAG: hypothetical protein GX591_16295, partial [Planctomycetes bacterium]|nr:hypothetical protein [Planctomycetota bacterium]